MDAASGPQNVPTAGSDTPTRSTDAFLEGRIVNEEQIPLASVSVGLTDRPDPTAETDEAGTFRLGPLEPGSVRLIFQKSGYRTVQRDVDVFRGGTELLRVVMAAVPVDEPREELYTRRGYIGLDFRVAGIGCGACGQITEPEKHAQSFETDTTGDGLRTIIVGTVWTKPWPFNTDYIRGYIAIDGEAHGSVLSKSPLTFRLDDLPGEARIILISHFGSQGPGESYMVMYQQPVDVYVNLYYYKNATAGYNGVPVG